MASTINIYDFTVPYFTTGLNMLAHILTKAQAYCTANNISESDFLASRLAPDMHPLPFQIQTASNTAKNTLVRLVNAPAVPMSDTESSFAELQERIRKTLEILQGAKREDFEGLEPLAEIKVPMGKMGEIPFTKVAYVQTFAVPNFYFHATTAYAIVRSKGVEVGKGDFLRPPSVM